MDRDRKRERNILQTVKRKRANCIGKILRRNCILERVTERKIERMAEVTERRERGSKLLLDAIKENRLYWKLKEEALDRAVWRIRFGRGR
jgi:hypothetical protein